MMQPTGLDHHQEWPV